MGKLAQRLDRLLEGQNASQVFHKAVEWYGHTVTNVDVDIRQFCANGTIPNYLIAYLNHLQREYDKENTADDIYPSMINQRES